MHMYIYTHVTCIENLHQYFMYAWVFSITHAHVIA